MSRAHTPAEMRKTFLHAVAAAVRFWAKVTPDDDVVDTARYKLEGLAFSFLCMLDGVTGGLPAFEVIPSPHESDMQFAIDNGENYYPYSTELHKLIDEGGVVTLHSGAGDYLHHMIHDIFKGRG